MNKILNWNQIQTELSQYKESTIVFTNGCFDIIHAGHIQYLNEAKNLGDLLIVGLNSDKSIRNIKGKNRPIVNEQNRA
ncbi:MAG: adenylyltransferase/cytidyltransferase family protein, partial [Candidatus Cloacimonadota bacterium]|nr:adenylyltransferase/cytidyltransferase family protein [Candidatus Cloacimonadota bacterium]